MFGAVSPSMGESTPSPKIHGLVVLTVVSSALWGTVPGGLVSSMVEPPPLQLISVIATNAPANNKRITLILPLHLAKLFFALRPSGPTILAVEYPPPPASPPRVRWSPLPSLSVGVSGVLLTSIGLTLVSHLLFEPFLCVLGLFFYLLVRFPCLLLCLL